MQIPICQLHLIISEATKNNVWNLTVYLWTHKLQFVESSTNNRAVVVLKATLPYYGDLDQNLNEFIWFECINVTSEDIGTLPFEDFLEQFNNIDLVSMENNLDQNAMLTGVVLSRQHYQCPILFILLIEVNVVPVEEEDKSSSKKKKEEQFWF